MKIANGAVLAAALLLPALAGAQADKTKAADSQDEMTTSDRAAHEGREKLRGQFSGLRKQIEASRSEVSTDGKRKLDELRDRLDRLEERARPDTQNDWRASRGSLKSELRKIQRDLDEIRPASGHEHPEDALYP